MSNAAVHIADVSFSYGGPNALEHVDLQVQRGEFLGVIGPNGGGKTTLLKLILGLLTVQRGSVRVLGTTPARARPRIGYCPQHGRFQRGFPITVNEVVAHGRLRGWRPFGRLDDDDRHALADALHAMNLTDLRQRPLSALSGGQIQRVLIARALACEPQILLLDEPVAHVDPRGGASLFENLRTLSDELTIVVVSHDIGFISSYVDRVACLNRTLDCHSTADITSDLMDRLYGDHVKLIDHAHGEAEADPSIPSLQHQ